MLLRKLVAKEVPSSWHTLAPTISREDHSSFASSAFACSGGAPALREIFKDMEQNNEDSMGTKRSAEIHSDEVRS